MSLQKEEVIKAFHALLADYEKNKARVATREELAERSREKEVVDKAVVYTTDSIVKGLAELQLNFSDTIGKWTDTLQTESQKYEELQKAIDVEARRLQELHHVKVAAGALYLLRQSHQAKTQELDREYSERTASLDETIARLREIWEKEQKEYELSLVEYAKKLEKERLREQEEYKYNLERVRKMELDEYEQKKRLMERELSEENQRRESDWKERQLLMDQQKEAFEANRKKIEEFPAKLEEELKKEREDAAKDASREARVKAELLEKEEVANKQIGEHKISSLEKTIENNLLEIQKLTDQLNEALRKVQELSASALANSKNQAAKA